MMEDKTQILNIQLTILDQDNFDLRELIEDLGFMADKNPDTVYTLQLDDAAKMYTVNPHIMPPRKPKTA